MYSGSSIGDVDREIAAEKARPETPATPKVLSEEELEANIGREIDRIFAEGFPKIFKPAARSESNAV